ncbi:uncharacterized protein PGTG_18629 [Puccinia graminis f. sp. tritici CRL 75-36-700-3]|uniref:Uncharacterized protein n=1 Tax=Puccinia graminis f. sp. tritici (strain CRL 75-36-700-3 / race SCCL) TaxID=418459 RepID=E3L7V5_PUCGT|nr:uncharacterized protein PGTG_18629 [Puccinia graminis f. sp. tritici CRL 75-36-700-3]EFP92630.1 hypothetical protein PGTG_18629 [Puccinia graminis f. sp. tritici CRL 75-36-700-3]
MGIEQPMRRKGQKRTSMKRNCCVGILGMRWKEIRDKKDSLEEFEVILRRGLAYHTGREDRASEELNDRKELCAGEEQGTGKEHGAGDAGGFVNEHDDQSTGPNHNKQASGGPLRFWPKKRSVAALFCAKIL